eukprot:sb/3477626/
MKQQSDNTGFHDGYKGTLDTSVLYHFVDPGVGLLFLQLKSGCLSLLTIRRFWHSRRVRAVVRAPLRSGCLVVCLHICTLPKKIRLISISFLLIEPVPRLSQKRLIH